MTDRVLIVVFDALRPEFVTPELMPRLRDFADNGVSYSRARSTFPTETRVNQSAVITGCMPHKHGIVGNRFLDASLAPEHLINSGNDDHLEPAFAAGTVLTMSTLGQRLSQKGKSYAALSGGTPGGGRLINWSAEQDNSLRLAMRRPGACAPPNLFESVVQRIGPLPEYELPAIDWINWAVDAYLDVFEQYHRPDVMLLWLCEPDESFHWHGIGSEASLKTIRHADREFGRILDRLADEIANGLNVITLSDHGQVSLSGDRLDLSSLFNDAGFTVSRTDPRDADAVVSIDSAGGIWVRDRDPELVSQLVRWLLEQSWCGPIFTRDAILDTLPLEHVRMNHDRAPDISVVMANSSDPNAFGRDGSTLHDAPYAKTGGCHGGLNARELHTFLAMSGNRFRQGQTIDAPAGNIDILPTVLSVLGMPIPPGIDGRVLSEAMRDGPALDELQWADQVFVSGNPGRTTHLSVSDIGPTRYLNAAWTD